jgi:hypothetical protein
MGRSFFSALIFSITLLAIPALVPNVVLASDLPNFPSCSAPSGDVIASYSEGVHGIVGDYGTYTGSDTVYSQGEGNVLQCFCGESGIQTEWWNVSELSAEDTNNYKSHGSLWGLDKDPYLALNSNYDCSSPSPIPTTIPEPTATPEATPTTSDNSNNSSGAPVCNAVKPGTPTILSAVRTGNSEQLTWTSAANATYYSIVYGNLPDYQYGVANTGNVTSYTVNNLTAGVVYHFAVNAVNDCMPGDTGTQSGTGTGGQVLGASTMAGTGVAEDNLFNMIFILGSVLTTLGIRKFSRLTVK